jgi:flagellar hook-associated protein 3 FlgL
MISNLDPSNFRFLQNLNTINRRIERAQQEITSGKRMLSPADDPDQISALLAARASLAGTQQVNANLSRVRTEVDAAERGLQAASKALERARTLGAQGASGTQTAESRAQIATEINVILEQLVGISRTAIDGRFIFSGDADQTPPYALDPVTGIISVYQGAGFSREIQHPNGSRFQVGKTAQEIFDTNDGSKNVFVNLQALRDGLRANNQTSINSALETLGGVARHLEQQLAYYGATQNQVAGAVEYGRGIELDLKTQIGNLEDADTAAAILELNQAQTQQSAALQSRAQVRRQSLFDFLR